MAVFVSMLRGVNVGGHRRMPMEALRAAYADCGITGAKTVLQSGNVVFRAKAGDEARLIGRLEAAILAAFGFPVDVILRSAGAVEAVVAGNPYPFEAETAPNRLLVVFAAAPLGSATLQRLRDLCTDSERLHASEREIYVFFGKGAGRSKLAQRLAPRRLGVVATARNWSTVLRLDREARSRTG